MPVCVKLQQAAGAARAALRVLQLRSQKARLLQPTSSGLSPLALLERRYARQAVAWAAGAKKHGSSSNVQTLLR